MMDEPSELDAPRRWDPATWIWLAAAVTAAVVLGFFVLTDGPPPDNQGSNYPGVGVELSTLRFEPLTGDAEPLRREDLRGKVTLINFWGPWCHFCRQEMPYLLEMREEFGHREDFRLVLVSNSAGGAGELDDLREDTETYLNEIGADPPVHHDPHLQSLAGLARDAKLPQVGMPITAVLDRQGVLRGLWIGFQKDDAAQMEELVKKLLEG